MSADGTFVVGTPNRVLTNTRYEHRRHMDPSHVQEFTPVSLQRTLLTFFESVDLYFEYVPGFWNQHVGPSQASFLRRVWGRTRRAVGRFGSDQSMAPAAAYQLDDIAFRKAETDPALALEAFALLAVCRSPRPRP